MTFKSFFKNSFTVLTVVMVITEIINLFNISLADYGSILMFSVISVAAIVFVSAKVWKRTKTLSDSDNSSAETHFSSGENPAPKPFQKEILLLKRFARQISEDKKELVEPILKDHIHFKQHVFDELELIQPSIDETIYTSFQQKISIQEQEFEDILKTLDDLKSDFLNVKSQLKDVSSLLLKLAIDDYSAGKAETAGGDFLNCKEDIKSNFLTSSLLAAKESFTKFTSETSTKGKEIIRNISEVLKNSRNDIQKEMAKFCFIGARNEQGSEENASMPVKLTEEDIENPSLAAFTFLNRQRVEMEQLQKSLLFFNSRFEYFLDKLGVFWQQGRTPYSSTSQRLEKANVLWNSVAEKVDYSSRMLMQQSKALTSMLADMKTILKSKPKKVRFFPSFKPVDESFCEPNKSDWIKNISYINQKLGNISAKCDSSQKNLDTLAQMSENFDNVHNLISSITEGYSSLLNIFVSSPSKIQRGDIKQNLTGKALTNLDVDKIRGIRNDVRQITEMNNSCKVDDSVWDEVRHELKAEFQNVDIDSIVFILKDIVETTWRLVEHRKDTFESPTESIQNNVSDQTDESECWGDIPSESCLTDVSSGFLIQNSDDSDDESRDMTSQERFPRNH